MKPTASTTARTTRSRAKAGAASVADTFTAAQTPFLDQSAMSPAQDGRGRHRRPTTAPPSAATATKSNTKKTASSRTRRGDSTAQAAATDKGAGNRNDGSESGDDLSDLSDLSDLDNDKEAASNDSDRHPSSDIAPTGGAALPPLPVPTRQPARKRPSTAPPASAADPLPAEPELEAVALQQAAAQDFTVVEEDMGVTSSDSTVVDVDDNLAARQGEEPTFQKDPAPTPDPSSKVLLEPLTTMARRTTRATRSSATPKAASSSSAPDQLPPFSPSTRATRGNKKAVAAAKDAGGMDIDQTVADPSSSTSTAPSSDTPALSSDTSAPPPTKKLKAKSHGPGLLPTISSTQSTPMPLATLKKLTSKKRLLHIESLLQRSDPEWIATAPDSPVALLDSLDWVVHDDAWKALSPDARKRLLALVPECDRLANGLDLVPGFWSLPAVVHQAVVYPDYVRAGMVVPVLADSLNTEAEALATAEPHVDADGDTSMPDTDAAPAPTPLPKPISQLRIMKALTGDLDPRSLPASDTDRAWLLALVGDGTGDDDAWKDENFERFWGDLDESLMRANRSRAGDSANVTLKHLFVKGMLRVGDVIWYRRKWMKPQPIAIELDLKVTKFQSSSGFCTTIVERDSYKHLGDATARATPTTDMALDSMVGEELVWKAPNQLEASIWGAVAPGIKRPNGNAWRDMRRIREDEDEVEDGVPLFKLRHDYLDEHEA